jgi:hypothetical protein
LDVEEMAPQIIEWRMALLLSASFPKHEFTKKNSKKNVIEPPFRSNPFPERIDKAAIWGKQSGRLSKIINSTPRYAINS